MNRAVLLAAIASLVYFASCKKNYTCQCFKSIDNQKDGMVYDTIKNITKRKAEKHCEHIQPLARDQWNDSAMVCYANKFYQ